MAAPFSRTLRALRADTGGASYAAMLGAMALLGAWGAWMTLARVTVWQRSVDARLEADRAVFPLDATVAARVLATHMTLGQWVREGDALVELDAQSIALRRDELDARRRSAAAQLDALRAQEEAVTRGLAFSQGELHSSLAVARARLHEAQVQASLAEAESRRQDRLHGAGLNAQNEYERARGEVERQQAVVDTLTRERRRTDLEGRARESSQRADIARITSDIARAEGELRGLDGERDQVAREIERYVVRAPVSGRLGSVVEVRVGSYVTAGTRLATVVPQGQLRVVAEFDAATVSGRMRPGLVGRVRFDGFPWTAWGEVPATVLRVGTESRDGKLRAELRLRPSPTCRIPLQHGLQGAVDVALERVAPAVLGLRAAGLLLDPREPPTPSGTAP